MRGLNMLSHNRWTFAASLAIVAMMAEGLESLSQGPLPRRGWFWLPAILTAGVFGYCVIRTLVPPELTVPTSNGSIALEDLVRGGDAFGRSRLWTTCAPPKVRSSFTLPTAPCWPGWPRAAGLPCFARSSLDGGLCRCWGSC